MNSENFDLYEFLDKFTEDDYEIYHWRQRINLY